MFYKKMMISLMTLLLSCAYADVRDSALSLYEKADERWEEFQKEVKWFLSEVLSQHEIPCPDDDDLEKSLHVEWHCKDIVEKEALLEAQEKFIAFRDALATLFMVSGNGAYADCSSASAILELTQWYTEYLENKYFPYGWKEDYLNAIRARQ